MIEQITMIGLCSATLIFWATKNGMIDRWAIINPFPKIFPSHCVLCLSVWLSTALHLSISFSGSAIIYGMASAALTQIAINIIWNE